MYAKKFNIRVYGLLINEKHELLLSNEQKGDFNFTKFPGGGLQWGEGTLDCLNREFKEELGIEIEVVRHFYTTDFFQLSAFTVADQLMSIYYLVSSKNLNNIQNGTQGIDEENHTFHWESIELLSADQLTFPIDQRVFSLLQKSTDQISFD